jgi:hypothetical protein
MSNKVLVSGVLFAASIASGFWLAAGEKPYNVLVLTLHKLISLGTFVYFGLAVYRLHKLTPLAAGQMAIAVLTVIFFLCLIATGGMLSSGKEFPAIVLKLHQIVPWLTLVSAGTLMVLLFA